MGLAGTKVKQRFGLDPRNTNWSNDTNRFGHQYMEKMGWKPGKGLGLVQHAMTTHVKVTIKEDNVGLGSKLARKQKKDEFDSGECAGLDVFQRILGRLNGKEDQINSELERQRKDNIINGKWGMHFVKGDVLRSTWDAEAKKLIEKQTKKRSRDDDDEQQRKAKKDKKEKKDRRDKKEKKEKSSIEDKSEIKEKKSKSKDKSDKKEKSKSKDKSEKKSKSKDKSEKRDKKSKSKETKAPTREEMLRPNEKVEKVIATRLSARAKWIKQKRASVMDAKALNEIFMVTN